MKKTVLSWMSAVLILVAMPYCKKKKSDGCSSETTLAVTTTPATGTTEPPAPGPDFPLTVNITSTMPPSGVTIDIKARLESSSTSFFTASKTTSTAGNNFSITGAPATLACVVEITVTSKTCNTNKWTGSYRFSKK